MKAKWDGAALENARYYIATTAYETEPKFIESGEYDAKKILSGLPEFDRSKDLALEIGCGIGRVMRAMNGSFSRLYGVDISGEMIRLGREWLREYPKIDLMEVGANGLDMFEDNKFDFVYSYITFQHIPYRGEIIKYIREAYRVLKPGGYFRFQTFQVLSAIGFVRNRVRILVNRKSDCFAGYSWTVPSLRRAVQACGFGKVDIGGKVEYQGKSPYPVGQPEGHVWCTDRKGLD